MLTLLQFDPDTRAEVTNVNTSKDLHGPDKKVLAIDVSITAFQVPAGHLANVLGIEADVGGLFWTKGGKPRITALSKPIAVGTDYKKRYDLAIAQDGETKFDPRKAARERCDHVHKFTLDPVQGHAFNVRFQCHISEPSRAFFDRILEVYGEASAPLALIPDLDLFAKPEGTTEDQ